MRSRHALLVLACLVLARESAAQEREWIRYYPPATSAFSGGPITSPLLAPNGIISAPAYSFSVNPDTGMWLAVNNIDLNLNANDAGAQINLQTTGATQWFVAAGASAGALSPASTDVKDVGSTTRHVAMAYVSRGMQGSKTKALTEGAATAVTQIAVPQTANANYADAVVHWNVYATDGTETQSRRGSTYLAAINKAGTETCTVGDIGTPVVAVSAGTLTCTATCTTGLTDVVQFALNCTSSLTQTALNAQARLNMMQVNTVTPQ